MTASKVERLCSLAASCWPQSRGWAGLMRRCAAMRGSSVAGDGRPLRANSSQCALMLHESLLTIEASICHTLSSSPLHRATRRPPSAHSGVRTAAAAAAASPAMASHPVPESVALPPSEFHSIGRGIKEKLEALKVRRTTALDWKCAGKRTNGRRGVAGGLR